MKFGHQLKTSLYPEWTFYYLSYDELKRELKTRTRGNPWSEEDETHFFEMLENDLEKVYNFQTVKFDEIKKRIQHCEKEINEATKDDYRAIEYELSMIFADVHDLAKFTRLNYTGFLKIIKKHDKQTKWSLKPGFMARLNAKPFYKENYDALIVKLSKIHDIVRNNGNPTKGNSSAGGQQQNFVRHTTKYWVHPDNITEVKLIILRHLPVLVFNANKEFESTDSAISSIYFDNENFDLYLGRLEKTEGAEAIRLRWYGGMDNSEIFAERKTHREDWTGEKSVKQRFLLKEKDVNKYLCGKYNLDAEKLRQKGKSEEEIQKDLQLASEVQYRILTKKLKPVLRTFYNRTAFQLPGDARVRISLDTELSMIREDNFENDPRKRSGNNWRRTDIGIDYPFSKLPDNEIVRFPYAILEVKLETQHNQSDPEWVQELVKSHLVESVPKFSKFIHGVATLMEDSKIQLLPFWFPQMDIDIRKKPQSRTSIYFQRPSTSSPTTPANESSNPLSEVDDDNIDILVDSQENDDEDANEGSPLLTYPNGSTSLSQNSIRQRNTPHISSLEELEEYFETITPAGQVPRTYKGKLIAFPVRVEPKVYFANERTFLEWLNLSLFMSLIAVGLLNFGVSFHIVVIYTIVLMFMMLYSLGSYIRRVNQIRRRESGPYVDRYGPSIVCGLLAISVILNFVFAIETKR